MARSADSQKTSRSLVLASICVFVAALYFSREVLIPLALAILLSFLLSPAVHWLERLRLPRVVATLIVVILSVSALCLIAYTAYRQTVAIVEQLPRYQAQLHTKIQGLRSHGNLVKKAQQEIRAAVGPETKPSTAPSEPSTSNSPGTASPNSARPPGPANQPPASQPSVENPLPVRVIPDTPTTLEVVRNYGAGLLDPLATAGLVLIFIIFMLIDREDLRDRMIRLLGHGRLNITTQALDEASTRISRYLGRLAIVNVIYAILVAAGLWLIGRTLGKGMSFPNVLLWGILVGVFRFVPYVGIWIGAAFPLVLSFALFPGNAVFFSTVGLFLVLEIVVSQFVEPYWYGASTGMTPLAVLVAAVFWTWLWGPIGLLLSTPLTVCLVVMGKHVPQLQFIDILLRDEPVLEPHLRIYQRLIADDAEEAAELAQSYLEERTLEQVFDEVLLAALTMAVHDYHRQRLDRERFASVLSGMRDIAEELADSDRSERVQAQAAKTVEEAKDAAPAESKRPPERLPAVPADCSINVLCLPARDEADEVVSFMLSELLALRGYCATSSTATPLASEMVEMVEQKQAQIICVSAMPPAAVGHARYLCKRLHARWAEMPMLVGLWNAKGDLARAKQRIGCSEKVRVVTTLAEAQDQIEQLAHPLVVNASA